MGTQVLLATTNLHLQTTGTRNLVPRWVGPRRAVIVTCTITARLGPAAYRLDLPHNMQQVHKVFQVSLIKQYRTDVRTQPPPPPVDDCTKRTVEQVLDHRVVRRGRQQKIGYLISWVSYAAESNT